MIVCPRCSKENQDHYKFCLGCGAELPRDATHQPKSFTAPTPPAGFSTGSAGAQPAAPATVSAVAAAAPAMAPVLAAAAPVPAASGKRKCTKCSSDVPPSFKFCGTCGTPMVDVAPTIPPTGATPAVAPAAFAAPAPRGKLIVIRADGSEGDSLPLRDGSSPIGREVGGPLAADAYLSPKHATFAFKGGKLHVTDGNSLNGVYVRIAANEPVALSDGSIFRVGQEILKFEILKPRAAAGGVEVMGSPDRGNIGRIVLVLGRQTFGNAVCVPASGMFLGRERGDVIFPDDGYVSGLHCRIFSQGSKPVLVDVGSSNGTYIRIRSETVVPTGSFLLMGQQLYRVQYT